MYHLNLFKSAFELNQRHPHKEDFKLRWNAPATLAALHRESPANGAKPLFLLHDGPPYANGSLHLGHFVNKSLKDALLKFKRLTGHFAPFVPGFDCHGLPVELEVEKTGQSKADPQAFVRACRTYALGQVAAQTKEFQDFGVSADWEQRYATLSPEFEAGAARLFLKLPQVVKRLRPVHWCPHCASSLAEAEVEHKPRLSDSVVVLFELVASNGTRPEGPSRYLQVWTTTPYTLPANKAVAFNAGLTYVQVDERRPGADTPVTMVRAQRDTDPAGLPSLELAGLHALSPYTGAVVPVVPADYVTRAGTGLVHLAPSFGLDDFRAGETHGLAVEHFVDVKGRFLQGEMQGMTLEQGAAHVLERVADKLYSQDKVSHEYPHCWRHKTPLFFKASEEWFLELNGAGQLGAKAQEALQDVQFVPAAGRERLSSMLRTRSSWCLSRTRLWGTPLADPEAAEEVALLDQVATQGVEAWHAGHARRTLDVWFDSGVTHELVLKQRFGRTADVYLEGSDQHRGWFQSSLLTAVAAGGPAPFKTLLTHGFVVDEKGTKYSKSSKNYQPLAKLFEKHSPDVLRLWALSQDYTRDLKMSEESLARTVERYRKLRNTVRFCLQNTEDFDLCSTVALTGTVHRAQVRELGRLVTEMTGAADRFDFADAATALTQFCESASNDYFTALKDTLYCDAPDAPGRREAQYVLALLLKTLVPLLVPLLPYTAEEVFQLVRARGGYTEDCSLLLTLEGLVLPEVGEEEGLDAYERFNELKHEVNRYVESQRGMAADGEPALKSAAQLDLRVTAPSALPVADLASYFGCAGLELVVGDEYSVAMTRTTRGLCPRCRQHNLGLFQSLCGRCESVEELSTGPALALAEV